MNETGSKLVSNHKEVGFSQRIGFGEKPSLLIVDFLKGFNNPKSPFGANFDKEIEATAKLLVIARKMGILVVFTIMGYEEGYKDAGIWIRKSPRLAELRLGSEMAEIDPRIAPMAGEYTVLKQFASAFFGTSLASLLTSQRIDTLIITGCTTSGCIRASVVDALQYGFCPIVPREGVGDRALARHEANLFDID